MSVDMLAELRALDLADADATERRVCDRCPQDGTGFCGHYWLCDRCRAAELAALGKEAHAA